MKVAAGKPATLYKRPQPADYHLVLRMERARKLLVETDRTVSQIGWELGYELSSSFSRKFREHTV